MTKVWDADGLIVAPSSNVNRYKHAFLQQVVCEFRFPILLELGGSKPPSSFVRALRKDYPYHELLNEFNLDIGQQSAEKTFSHSFRSSKGAWTINLKQSTFSLETSTYNGYADFKKRIRAMLDAASEVIDSDFFTRIGLRYINIIDPKEDPVSNGWVNQSLAGPLLSGIFKSISESSGRIMVSKTDGGCLLQHGVRLKPPVEGLMPPPAYAIDIDSYRNDVHLSEVDDAVTAMHSQAFDLFDWCLGEKSRKKLMDEPIEG